MFNVESQPVDKDDVDALKRCIRIDDWALDFDPNHRSRESVEGYDRQAIFESKLNDKPSEGGLCDCEWLAVY